jgi:hypothetical protein
MQGMGGSVLLSKKLVEEGGREREKERRTGRSIVQCSKGERERNKQVHPSFSVKAKEKEAKQVHPSFSVQGLWIIRKLFF